MSLFSKKPKSIADFEKEIEKLRQKKKLSARNSERLEEYEKQLSSLKTVEEAEQKKNVISGFFHIVCNHILEWQHSLNV